MTNDLRSSSVPAEQSGQPQENLGVGVATPSWFARFSIENVAELRDEVASKIEKINAQNQPFYEFSANERSKRVHSLKLLALNVYLSVAKAFAGVFSVFASAASFGYSAVSKIFSFLISTVQTVLSSSARLLSDARVWIISVATSAFDAVRSFAWPSIRLPQVAFCAPVCVSNWFARKSTSSDAPVDLSSDLSDDVEPLCGSEQTEASSTL